MIISDVDIRYTENMPILWGPFIWNFIYIFQDDYDNFIIPNADKLNCKKRLSHPVSEAWSFCLTALIKHDFYFI